MFGARRQGKTHLLSHLLYKLSRKRQWSAVFLFSETASVQDSSYEFIPDAYKYDSLDTGVLERILKTQRKIKEHNNAVDGEDKKPYGKILIICDDVINNKDVFYSPVVNSLFTQGRHFNVDICILSQSLTGLHPKARNNADAIIIFRSLSKKQRDSIVEWYLTIHNNKDSKNLSYAFMETIYQKPFTAMVLDIGNAQNVCEHCEYVFKISASAYNPPDFFLGKKKHWEDSIAL